MKLKNLFGIFAAMALVAFVGCENNSVETGDTTFKLETSELTVPATGGAQVVNYTITNHQNGNVVITNCAENWIKELSTATYGSISFNVAPNYKKEAREARIRVEYTGVELQYEILVKQEASSQEMFEFDVVVNNATDLNLTVTPADITSPFVCRIETKANMETFGFTVNDELLTDNDMALFREEASSHGQTLRNYLENIVHTGKSFDVIFEKLVPNTEYIVYAYHLDPSKAAVTSEVYRYEVTTSDTEMLDVTFDMSFNIDGSYVEQTITPSNSEVYYFAEYMKVKDFYSYYGEDADIATTFVHKWNENVAIKNGMGYYASNIIDEYAKQGTQTFAHNELAAETEYVFYVFAVNPETAFCASEIKIEHVTTEPVNESDMTISIEIKNIFYTTADIYWTASDPNATFRRTVLTKAQFTACGSTDAERFAAFEANGYVNSYTATGFTDLNYTKGQAGVTFVALAFGVDGETPNTRIFWKEFTFLSDIPGTSNISLTYDKHYNLAEVAAVDAEHWGGYTAYENYALVPMTINGVEEGDQVYYMLDTRPMDWYSKDSQWLSEVAQETHLKDNYHNCYMQLEYERDYIIIAVARDKNGNLGQLFKAEIYLYKSDSADVATYTYTEEK